MVLIRLPGIEKRLARDPRLDARVGLVQRFPPLSEKELGVNLDYTGRAVGPTFSPDDYTGAEEWAALTGITRGSMWLGQRLFAQVERVLEISRRTITMEVVDRPRGPRHRIGSMSHTPSRRGH